MRWWFRSENNVNIFLPCSSQFSLFLCVSRGSCLARNLLLLIIFSLFWTLGWNCWVCSFSLLRPWVGFLHYIVLAVCSISGLRLQQFYAGSLLPVCYQLWTSSETCSTFSTTHQLFVVFQRKGLPAHLPTPSPRTFSNNSLILTSCLNTLQGSTQAQFIVSLDFPENCLQTINISVFLKNTAKRLSSLSLLFGFTFCTNMTTHRKGFDSTLLFLHENVSVLPIQQ